MHLVQVKINLLTVIHIRILLGFKMKRLFQSILFIVLSAAWFFADAQNDSAHQTHHIAIFAPLYLDSAFDATLNYRFDKNFPKFLNPGLEFYEGAQLAIDSLQKEGATLAISLYDTKSSTNTIAQILQSNDFQNTELILGHVSPLELRQLANAALRQNIPFINVNFPNDGNITNNQSLVILNPTLKTHCAAIYKFLQNNYGTLPITVFRKKGATEDKLKNYFIDIEKNTSAVPLKLKYITLEDNFDSKFLKHYLDSNFHNIFVVASLDEGFAKNFCFQLSSLTKMYQTSVIGMPTWDNISDFSQPLYNGLEILYSTPFYINQNDSLVSRIQQYFKTNFYMRASDMVFRGFEITYHFTKLLQLYSTNLSSSIGEKKYEVFDAFDIEPVFLNKQNMVLDYFENKKLYFIKKVDGNISTVY
jgi:hypothetical protein